MRLTTAAACFLLAATAHAQTADQDPCEALKQVKLPGVEVRQIVFTKAGAEVGDLQSAPAFLGKEPAFCRVLLTGHPSEDSSIATEVWLPLAWNGRLRGQGNGGFAGFLDYPAMAAAVQQGFVTVATDTGHRGGTPDFALHHPEKVKDFGWRAVHEMTVAAKAYAEKLYGKQPLHSYFASCSDGGREALMEAERFPADYDGILAGAPAWNWTGLVSAAVVKARQFTDPATAIPAGKIPAIAAAVREACDKLDGVADGVLNDPRTCHFDPARLQCTAGDGPDCLTAGQVATLRGIYRPTLDQFGHEIQPPLLPGAEDGPNGWTQWITGTPRSESLALFFGRGFYADFVYDRADWKLADFNLDRDLKLARGKVGADLDANDPNLKPFTGRGGKLILYHGWNDPAIPALSTIEFYTQAQAALGAAATDQAIRLYMVPGMKHCGSGPGATSFGQNGTDARSDPDHDVFAALERWVEAGKAPATITATHYKDENPAKGAAFTRPLCPYPASAVLAGTNPDGTPILVCHGQKDIPTRSPAPAGR